MKLGAVSHREKPRRQGGKRDALMKRTAIAYALAFLAITLLTTLAAAQETRATISGAALDPSGAALPGVKITVTEVRTGLKVSTTSDAAGQYNVPFLPPGEYQI